MTATASPFGFQPVVPIGGYLRTRTNGGQGLNGIAAAYATSIPFGAPVIIDTATGGLNVAGTSGAIAGIFLGVQYVDGNGIYNHAPFWPTGGVPNATQVVAYYIDAAAGVEFNVQANGSIAATAIGDQANCVNPGLVRGYGMSGAALSSTLAGAGVAAQFTIVGFTPSVTEPNLAGDAFTIVRVRINQSQTGPGSVNAI